MTRNDLDWKHCSFYDRVESLNGAVNRVVTVREAEGTAAVIWTVQLHDVYVFHTLIIKSETTTAPHVTDTRSHFLCVTQMDELRSGVQSL